MFFIISIVFSSMIKYIFVSSQLINYFYHDRYKWKFCCSFSSFHLFIIHVHRVNVSNWFSRKVSLILFIIIIVIIIIIIKVHLVHHDQSNLNYYIQLEQMYNFDVQLIQIQIICLLNGGVTKTIKSLVHLVM